MYTIAIIIILYWLYSAMSSIGKTLTDVDAENQRLKAENDKLKSENEYLENLRDE